VAEPKEILSFEDLRKYRLADEGYFVITDSTRDAIIHKVNSKCVKADSFNLKVTINDRKQGSYFGSTASPRRRASSRQSAARSVSQS